MPYCVKMVKLKSLAFGGQRTFQRFMAGKDPFGTEVWYELEEELGHDLDTWSEIQALVMVGDEWQTLRAKVREECYHCDCGACSPEYYFYVVPEEQTEGEASAI